VALYIALATLPRAYSAPSPVAYKHIVRRHPNISIHVVTVDLTDARIGVRVARCGPMPPGDGTWTTTLEPVSEIASREGFDIAINGDFFLAEGTRDIEGRNTGYIRGKLATPVGLAMTDGQLWHRPEKMLPCLAIGSNHAAWFGESTPSETPDPSAAQILSGSQMIVSAGMPVDYTSRFATNRHPRTAAGIDRTGTILTLVVVDGRQPKLSIGMTLKELSREMIRLGCYTAINLDGGGSTTMVYRAPKTHALKVINSPSDTRERSVAEALGIIVRAPIPPPD
jgi:exopolysaccharide biosynthesis protein